MKKISTIAMLFVLTSSFVSGQNQDSTRLWNFSTDVNLYFFRDEFFVLPVFKADKNALHLEARYNYEDRQTFSGWIGYNFTGGNEFQFAITPMIGGVFGQSNGIAPGLEFTLSYKRFELYSEGEYLYDVSASENNFLYNWADFTYSPRDWWWFGISGQRTRLYETDLDIQRGLLIGGGTDRWEATGYLYNIGYSDTFFLLTLTANF